MRLLGNGTFDMHIHTHYSDGDEDQSLEAVCKAAAEAGISHLGITDHDVAHNSRHCSDIGAKYGVNLISGCEVSCFRNLEDGRRVIVHLGAHWLHPHDKGMAQILRHNQNQDFPGRVMALLHACAKQGLRPYGDTVENNFERIRAAHPHSLHFGKRAVTELMAESGCVPDRSIAYQLMARGGPAYVPVEEHMNFVSIEEATEVITRLSLCTLNHLYYSGLEKSEERRLLLDFVKLGGDALEAIYHRYSDEQRSTLVAIANELSLLVNVGSDRHEASRDFMQGDPELYMALRLRQRQKHGCLWGAL